MLLLEEMATVANSRGLNKAIDLTACPPLLVSRAHHMPFLGAQLHFRVGVACPGKTRVTEPSGPAAVAILFPIQSTRCTLYQETPQNRKLCSSPMRLYSSSKSTPFKHSSPPAPPRPSRDRHNNYWKMLIFAFQAKLRVLSLNHLVITVLFTLSHLKSLLPTLGRAGWTKQPKVNFPVALQQVQLHRTPGYQKAFLHAQTALTAQQQLCLSKEKIVSDFIPPRPNKLQAHKCSAVSARDG